MEPEGSIPNSQELSICSYPEPDQCRPRHPIPRRRRRKEEEKEEENWYDSLEEVSPSYDKNTGIIADPRRDLKPVAQVYKAEFQI
jgi:hypothetical protein